LKTVKPKPIALSDKKVTININPISTCSSKSFLSNASTKSRRNTTEFTKSAIISTETTVTDREEHQLKSFCDWMNFTLNRHLTISEYPSIHEDYFASKYLTLPVAVLSEIDAEKLTLRTDQNLNADIGLRNTIYGPPATQIVWSPIGPNHVGHSLALGLFSWV
jgi:hypothetical protein